MECKQPCRTAHNRPGDQVDRLGLGVALLLSAQGLEERVLRQGLGGRRAKGRGHRALWYGTVLCGVVWCGAVRCDIM